MSDEHDQELAALYALGLLEGAERFSFEARLTHRADLRALVSELEVTTATLAAVAPQVAPPSSLKASILAAARKPEQGLDPSRGLLPFPVARLLPWAAAACFALTAVWLGLRASALRAENESLATQRDLAEVATQIAQSQLAERTLVAESMINDLGTKLRRSEDLSRLRIAALASLLKDSAEARAIAVWDNDRQSGLLTVEHLPAISPERDYQIWVIDPQYPIPVDGGVFHPSAEGKATIAFRGDKPIQSVSAFAVSLEKKGGVPKAEGPLVLLGKL